jgi:hypothetical protein
MPAFWIECSDRKPFCLDVPGEIYAKEMKKYQYRAPDNTMRLDWDKWNNASQLLVWREAGKHGTVTSAKILPYHANPRVNWAGHENYDPSFCFDPEGCKGKNGCQRDPCCTN